MDTEHAQVVHVARVPVAQHEHLPRGIDTVMTVNDLVVRHLQPTPTGPLSRLWSSTQRGRVPQYSVRLGRE
jgi:predicted thioesterase